MIRKFKIDGKVWEIKDTEDATNGLCEFVVYLNGEIANHLCGGGSYETESGACYAILNEYSVDT